MLFNSIHFAIFLPIIFILYWATPNNKIRNLMLLVASYYFYMSWNYKLVFLILATTAVSYLAARLLEKQKHKKIILLTTLAVCLGILIFFKYFNFLSLSVTTFLSAISLPVDPITLKLILPVGISFYTFQTLSYVVDVYRGTIPVEKNFFSYALYVSFFPQLVAGPIERPENLIPQFKTKHIFDYEKAAYGAKMIAIGAFKKIVVADTISVYVNNIYNNPYSYSGFVFILATLFFAIQIYCDFSGYTDIAIGTAKLLGFDLMKNFNAPYLATSIKDFWARWHISLSSWFKDYVYIPLGGSRVSKPKHFFNLMVTFLLSGLWHGASWTFVIWGIYHGILNILQTILGYLKIKPKIPSFFKIFFTFTLVTIGWMFFRANNVSDIFYIASSAFKGILSPFTYICDGFSAFSFTPFNAIAISFAIIVLFVIDFLNKKTDVIDLTKKLFAPIRYIIYITFIYIPIIVFFFQLQSDAPQAFIYFQF